MAGRSAATHLWQVKMSTSQGLIGREGNALAKLRSSDGRNGSGCVWRTRVPCVAAERNAQMIISCFC